MSFVVVSSADALRVVLGGKYSAPTAGCNVSSVMSPAETLRGADVASLYISDN